MLTAITLVAAIAQPCPLVKHRGAITPVQSCVVSRPLIVTAAPDPDPLELEVITRYQIIETAQPCPAYVPQQAGWFDGFDSPVSPRASWGVAMRAPEIDPGSALTSITLLLGCLVVLRSKS